MPARAPESRHRSSAPPKTWSYGEDDDGAVQAAASSTMSRSRRATGTARAVTVVGARMAPVSLRPPRHLDGAAMVTMRKLAAPSTAARPCGRGGAGGDDRRMGRVSCWWRGRTRCGPAAWKGGFSTGRLVVEGNTAQDRATGPRSRPRCTAPVRLRRQALDPRGRTPLTAGLDSGASGLHVAGVAGPRDGERLVHPVRDHARKDH